MSKANGAGAVAPRRRGEAKGYTQVKVDSALVTKAKTMAAHKKKTLADYVSDALRKQLQEDYKSFKKEIDQELEDLGGEKGKK